MKVIGVTGGIGSGKSTAAGILKKYGAAVIDADLIARKIVRKGEEALNELVAFFGAEILDPSGELDRKKLSGMVFNNKENLEVLNRITHKYIVEEIKNSIHRESCKSSVNFIVLDVPIPVKQGFLDVVDEVWVVTANKDERIKRVMERSGYTREEAINRIDSQMKDEEYSRIADVTVINNEGIEELEKRLSEFLKKSNSTY